MTGLLILTFIPAAAAVLFWLRVRQQRRQIDELTRRLIVTGMDTSNTNATRGTLLGTVAHELRSPIAAILGYEELMSEGVFGDVDPRTADALLRIRSSARQMLTLTDGMQELAQEGPSTDVDWEDTDFVAALAEALVRAQGEAAARRVELVRIDNQQVLPGESEQRALDAVLDAACGAALKTSAERTVRVSVAADGAHVRYRFEGTALDPERVEREPFGSGAGLRIAIARRLAARVGGSVGIERVPDDTTTIEIVLPRRARADATSSTGLADTAGSRSPS